MAYAHVQMMMYRPFIHYVVQGCSADVKVDKRSFACAAACVSVARNIVHITTEMKKRGLLVGAYWFVMYTTYFAILSLVFFVLSNPDSPTGKEILKDALEGRDTLASLARRSLAADRCTFSLTVRHAQSRTLDDSNCRSRVSLMTFQISCKPEECRSNLPLRPQARNVAMAPTNLQLSFKHNTQCQPTSIVNQGTR